MIQLPVMAAVRRALRRHQGLGPPGRRMPMWRLLGGEILWAGRQVVARPGVLLGAVGGFVATLAVLDAAAPGPVLGSPWRLLVAVAAGFLVASGVRGIELVVRARTASAAARPAGDEEPRPVLGVAVIAGVATLAVLVVWLLVWVAHVVV